MTVSPVQPITVWGHASGPNPWKVAMFLQELGLPYELKFIEFPEMKKAAYTSLNPNGRVPTIQDPNTGITLAESGAILQYLAETYDKEGKFHSLSGPKKYAEYQWLHFQMSGQGPYFGQKAWFSNYHAEKLPSAEKRYANEISRVLGVIDSHLKKQNTEYLTGNKVSYADFAWVSWNSLLGWLVPELNVHKEFPRFAAWNEKLLARPAIVKVLADKAEANA